MLSDIQCDMDDLNPEQRAIICELIKLFVKENKMYSASSQ